MSNPYVDSEGNLIVPNIPGDGGVNPMVGAPPQGASPRTPVGPFPYPQDAPTSGDTSLVPPSDSPLSDRIKAGDRSYSPTGVQQALDAYNSGAVTQPGLMADAVSGTTDSGPNDMNQAMNPGVDSLNVPQSTKAGAPAPQGAAGPQDDWVTASQNAAKAGYDAEMAKGNAVRTVEEQKAAALTEAGKGFDQIQSARLQARNNNEHQADMETAAWVQKMDQLAKQEPNRNRYWENSSSFGKAMWLMGVAFTALGNVGHPGIANNALQMLEGEINADTQAQKDRLSRQLEQGKLEGSILTKKQDRRVNDSKEDYDMMITKWSTLKDAALAKAAVLPPESQQAVALANASQYFSGKMVEIAKQQHEDNFKLKEKKSDQDAEMARAQLASWTSRSNNNATIAGENTRAANHEAGEDRRAAITLAGKQVDAGAKAASEYAKDYEALTPEMHGVTLTDSRGQPLDAGKGAGAVPIRAANFPKAGALAANAQQYYSDMQIMSRELKKTPDIDILMSTNPTFQAAAQRVARGQAKSDDPNGKYTDKDVDQGFEENAGLKDKDSPMGKARMMEWTARYIKQIDQTIANYPKRIGAQMSAYIGDMNDPAVRAKGPHISWSPKQMEEPDVKAHSTDEQRVGAGLAPAPVKEPSTVEEYNAQAKDEERFPGQGLPKLRPESQKPVEDAVQVFKDSPPSYIQEISDKTQANLPKDQTARMAVRAAAEKALEVATKREQSAKDDLREYRIDHPNPEDPVAFKQKATSIITRNHLGNIDPTYVAKLIKDVDDSLAIKPESVETFSGDTWGTDNAGNRRRLTQRDLGVLATQKAEAAKPKSTPIAQGQLDDLFNAINSRK